MSFSTMRRRLSAVAAAVAAALIVPALGAPAFAADQPPASTLPATVSADALPTVQINGVAWNQLVVGNTVYVVGQFTSARPAGSAAGQNEVARSNILAYDIRTGALITSWAPTLNGTGYGLAASADGTKIYVSGSFTAVNGQTQYRVAALDAATGSLISGFRPAFDSRVRAITVVGNTLYAGGIFSKVGSVARSRLAAVNASTGALLPWAPSADAEVMTMVAVSSTPELVVGGRFAAINGETFRGTAALDLTSGSTMPWALASQVYAYGPDSAVYSLTTDGTGVYGTAYDFDRAGNFENSFAAEAAGGTFRWLNGCLGDTYGNFALGGVLYTAGHTHDCRSLDGGLPETSPRSYQWAIAETTAVSGAVNRTNAYGWAGGKAAPTLLHWTPTFTAGTFTGQSQASWTVTGNSQYLVYGGEFPTVNGRAQQGLVRFAVRSSAPGKEGPQGGGDLTPSVTATYPGTVRVAWKSAWDRDDKTLTYELLRGPVNSTVVVASTTGSSEWWDRPPLALTDPAAPSGRQSYRIRVTDPSGNTVTGSATVVTVLEAGRSNPYVDAVKADGATDYWRLGDASGVVGIASLGQDDLLLDSSESRNQTGALPDGDPATTFTGVTAIPLEDVTFGAQYRAVVPASTTTLRDAPATYSTEAWFKTTTTSGGQIIGFADSKADASYQRGRNTYMTDDGRLVSGIYSGKVRTVTSAQSYNDGAWHHVVTTFGAGGLALYVDGVLTGRDAGVVNAEMFKGYWRVGGDNLDGWTNQPTSRGFAGTIDDVSVYPTALTSTQVRSHYTTSGRTPTTAARPADAYGQAVYDDAPDSYWRLEETSGTVAADSSAAGIDGTYFNDPTLSVAGAVGTKGASLDGTDDTITSTQAVYDPTQYSVELWFNTTTTAGGRMIGFGSERSGYSKTYDRQVWMHSDGTVDFGVWTGKENRATSTKAYNDGKWHHLVASQGSAGMVLAVDGRTVATNAQQAGLDYSGYWRVGGDHTWSGGSSDWFGGSVDEVATYSSQLTTAQVANHFSQGGGDLAPDAAFTATSTETGWAFDASTSTDDKPLAGYSWDFGDGTTGTGVTTTHSYAVSGSYVVTLTVTDSAGQTATATRTVVAVVRPTDAYGVAVAGDGPEFYYRFSDAAGRTTAGDSSPAGNIGILRNGATTGAPGIVGTGLALDGVDDFLVETTGRQRPTQYSAELWFNTTSTRGGKLIGTGNANNGTSWSNDRNVTMQDNGALSVNVYNGTENRYTTTARYNDGQWHHLVLTQGTEGLRLYVDGSVVLSNAQTGNEAGFGYWRIGGDTTWRGTSSSYYIAGSVDEVAVYNRPLTAAEVTRHYIAAGRNPAPTAAFTATATDLQLAVDGSASTDPGATVASYAWSFGDGTTAAASAAATTTHAYSVAGTYTVTLTVTDNDGATGTSSQQVTVRAPRPTAPTDAYGAAVYAAGADAFYRLEEAAGSTTTANSSQTGNDGSVLTGVTLGANGIQGGHAATFDGKTGQVVDPNWIAGPTTYSTELWFNTTSTRGGRLIGFGDRLSGNSGSNDRAVWLTRDGTMHFGTWTGRANLVDTTASYNDGTWHHVVATQGPAGMVLYVDGAVVGTNPQTGAQSYSGFWKVGGDASWGNQDNGYFDGAIDEIAVYSTVLGASTVADHYAKGSAALNTPPTAVFTSAVSDLAATFDASASADADGTVSSYAWDFGDGTTGTGATTSHTYATAGTAQVTLTVTDDKGATATVTHAVTTTAPVNQAPTAVFTSAVSDLAATFDASASADADGTVSSYAWDFGDGTTGTGATTSHTYATAGTAQVTLTVTDDKGATATVTHPVTTTAPAPVNTAPTAAFTSVVTDLAASFDGTGSTDAEGPIASYAWDFGDGTTGTGATTSHTYTAAGTHTVTLTVTDAGGLTSSVTHDVVLTSPAPANQAPTASFTSSVTNLRASVDASASADSDGSITSYAWDFGDGTTDTGRTVSHTYTTAGTYQVTLVVTDDKGAKGSVVREVVTSVPVPANVAPTAAFTSSVADLKATLNGSSSTDSDGTIASYAWDFGDQTSASGATTSHTYTVAGTYQVTLTVTDDKGATGSVTKAVTVTASTPPAATAVAQDTFGRTTTGGWGSAEVGGAWTTSGGAGNFSVDGSVGRLVIAGAGSTSAAYLNGVSSSDTDVRATFSLDKAATGGGTYVSLLGRRVGTSDYRAKVKVAADGSLTLSLVKVVGGTETSLRSVALTGTTLGVGQQLVVRLQVVGSGTTSLNAKAWLSGGAEPASWAATATDATAGLQAAGGVGVLGYLSASSTNAPITLTVDDMVVTRS